MTGIVSLVDAYGVPLPPASRSKAQALVPGSGVPYDAASRVGQHMATWNPWLTSADTELNPWRDTIVSRVRDLVRNDGWAAGAVTRTVDNAIGASYRPIAKPDWRALQSMTGNPGFDAEWADTFGRAAEAAWRSWADDPGKYCDAGRRMTFSQMCYVGFRHLLIDGDALAGVLWLPDRVGHGRARYSTAVQLVDPDRLSNPNLTLDRGDVRGGVEIDEHDAAVAYHIRKAHQSDWWSAGKSFSWERVPRENDNGRPVMVHYFDQDRAGQHRGGAGILAPVLQRLKMLIKYDGAELDAAIINAMFGAYVESPFDQNLVAEAVGGGEDLGAYQTGRAEYHDAHKPLLGGARIPILFPGEKIGVVSAARPAGAYPEFTAAVLRNVAAAAGISEAQISQDWSRTNYSSARAALLEAWKTLGRRRTNFGIGFAAPIYAAVLEESIEIDELPLPAGFDPDDFALYRGAFSRARWMGPGRGWIDPVAEKQGSVLGLEAGLSTLEDECADNAGADWEEVLQQRSLELKRCKELDLPLPSWAGAQALNAEPSNQGGASQKPAVPT